MAQSVKHYLEVPRERVCVDITGESSLDGDEIIVCTVTPRVVVVYHSG
jgi:hypothetical protein